MHFSDRLARILTACAVLYFASHLVRAIITEILL